MILGWALFSLLLNILYFFGMRGTTKMRYLSRQVKQDIVFPRLSIIVPACNEAQTVALAMQSVLALDYPDLEVIAVNDRSTDGTGEILDQLEQLDRRLKVIHLTTLPEGWMGKNHALYVGSQHATGEYLLFTDADVIYQPSCLRLAVAYAIEHQLDSLVLMPKIIARKALLQMVLLIVIATQFVMSQSWRVRTGKRNFVGSGMFAMVKKTHYDKMHGHKSFALEIVDDMMLGKVIKMTGGRQDCLFAMDLMAIEWYRDLPNFISGLEKSAWGGNNYSFIFLSINTLVGLMQYVFPFLMLPLALFMGAWTVFAMSLITVVLALFGSGHYLMKLQPQWPQSIVALMPVAVLVIYYAFWRSAFLAESNGYITWRGTKYSIHAIKAAHESWLTWRT